MIVRVRLPIALALASLSPISLMGAVGCEAHSPGINERPHCFYVHNEMKGGGHLAAYLGCGPTLVRCTAVREDYEKRIADEKHAAAADDAIEYGVGPCEPASLAWCVNEGGERYCWRTEAECAEFASGLGTVKCVHAPPRDGMTSSPRR